MNLPVNPPVLPMLAKTRAPLAKALHDDLHLTGTKIVCGDTLRSEAHKKAFDDYIA